MCNNSTSTGVNVSQIREKLGKLCLLHAWTYLWPMTALTFLPAVGRALAGRADHRIVARCATVGADLWCCCHYVTLGGRQRGQQQCSQKILVGSPPRWIRFTPAKVAALQPFKGGVRNNMAVGRSGARRWAGYGLGSPPKKVVLVLRR